METITVDKLSSSSKVLNSRIEPTIDTIKKWVEEKGYRIIGLDELDLTEIESKLSGLTMNQRKKVRNAMNRAVFKPTLASVNMFFHSLSKRVLKSDRRVRVKISESEEQYLIARKEAKKAWKESLTQTERLRVAFRSIKRKS